MLARSAAIAGLSDSDPGGVRTLNVWTVNPSRRSSATSARMKVSLARAYWLVR